MIVSIQGILKYKQPDEIIINVHGLGYSCYMTNNTFDSLGNLDEEVSLLTYFHVTENSQQLFAFSNKIERELFMMLISVSGIGPKTAIVLLSAISPDEFKKRLIAGEVSMLTALPGIGPKTARRIIVELKDKFVKISNDELPKEDVDNSPEVSDACDALLALGFQIKDIRPVISKVQNKDKQLGTEQIIKKALIELQ